MNWLFRANRSLDSVHRALSRQTPSSGGLANPGRVGAALRSLGLGGSRTGAHVLCHSVVSDMLF